jgi:hypothetical protein
MRIPLLSKIRRMGTPSATMNSNSLASAKSQPETPIEEKKRSTIGLRPFLQKNYRKGDRYTLTRADDQREREPYASIFIQQQNGKIGT